MNERIRELWSQAGGHYNGGNQHTWPEYTITDPKKFAELIVRECMVVANTYQNRGGNCYVDDMIAKHFGVEE